MKELLEKYKTIKVEKERDIKSARDEQIKQFLGKGIMMYKKKVLVEAEAKDIAILLRHCKTEDLYSFLQECLKAKTFAKFFWYKLKLK